MKHHKNKHQIRRNLWISTVLTFAIITVWAGSAFAQSTPLVKFDPSEIAIGLGQTTEVTVQVENVANLYGVELLISFDPNLLEVVDADPHRQGIQITPGNFLSGGLEGANAVTGGNIEYIMQQVAPNPPASGSGALAHITFKGIGSGVANIKVEDLYMSNQAGQGIGVAIHSARITVQASGVSDPQPTVVTPTEAPVMPITPTPTTTPAPVAPPPTAVAQPPAAQPSGYNCAAIQGYHIVRRGETLYAIARAYATNPYAIGACNPTINPRRIHASNHLAIPYAPWTPPPGPTAARQFDPSLIPVPAPAPAPGCRAYHTVQSRETLTAIGLRYGANIWDIARTNRIYNLHLIHTGQVLCIP